MQQALRKCWVLGPMVWIGLCAAGPYECSAQFLPTPQAPKITSARGKPSIPERVSSSIKQGVDKLTQAVKPKTPVKPVDDPISLAGKGKPGVELYLSVARLYEESGKLNQAAGHYQKALSHSPNHLGALLGYAHLKNRLGEPEEAKRLYHRAVSIYPKEAPVHNNLALFYAQRGMLNESVAAFTRAIQLQPKNPKYRNNIATSLVEMGRAREAFQHLRAVHPEAVAHYNLGFLLELKRQPEAARQHYAFALRVDPSLALARRRIERLEQTSMQARTPAGQSQAGNRVGSLPARPTDQTVARRSADGRAAPVRRLPPPPERSRSNSGGGETGTSASQSNGARRTPPSASTSLRLPPTSGEQTAAPTLPPLPPGTSRQQPTSTAPLPSPAIRRPGR